MARAALEAGGRMTLVPDDPYEEPAESVLVVAHVRFIMTEMEGTVGQTIELADEILEHILRERFEDATVVDIDGEAR